MRLGFSSPATSGSAEATGSGPISVLIGSSGDAETTAVKSAVSDWSKTSGTEASVAVASDMVQQLSQGFAAGKPPDVFYVSTDQFAGFAANGSLEPYGDDLANKDDFYPGLAKAFSYDDKLYCAPKDFSTLSLVINTDMWTAAGLTDADIPTTWDQLSAAARKLTTVRRRALPSAPRSAARRLLAAGRRLLCHRGRQDGHR